MKQNTNKNVDIERVEEINGKRAEKRQKVGVEEEATNWQRNVGHGDEVWRWRLYRPQNSEKKDI